MINLRGETLSLFDALLDIGYIEDISFVETKEILPVERSTILGKTNGANIADLEKETKLSPEERFCSGTTIWLVEKPRAMRD